MTITFYCTLLEESPQNPWDRIHVDFTGPFEGLMWFVIIDAHSRCTKIFPMKHADTSLMIQCLRSLFSYYGLCKSIVSDNGTQFTSSVFKQFCLSNGITLILPTPYHSRSNDRVERVIRTFKSRFSQSKDKYSDYKHRLQVLLFTYRIIPHSSIGYSLAELFLSRRLNTIFLKVTLMSTWTKLLQNESISR